ncbi:MAG: hypothetical protein S4CHLAM6_03130 [Chlamydiae bacterium]|nr:hypothetical protein [Chlamydiota bacterium]
MTGSHTINPHVMSQAASTQQHKVDSTKRKKAGGLGSSAPKKSAAPKGKGPFNPDDAVNAAINLQVGMIMDLADVTISMSSMDATLQKTAVSNSQSYVAMLKALLSAQGLCCNSKAFIGLVQRWGAAVGNKVSATAANFMKFCSQTGYADVFSGVYNNPNITSTDKDAFASLVSKWAASSNNTLSTFLGKGSVISNDLNIASTNLSNWQTVADSMKPTQVQQATTELVAEIGSESSMWTDVVSA